MTTELPTTDGPKPLRRFINRHTVIAFLAGAALAAAVGASAVGAAMSCSHAMMMDGTHSAADVSAHVDHMLKHLYVELDATAAQKAQIDPLVKQAVSDLVPLHSQLFAAHSQAMQALAQSPVDRTSLESARVEHLQLADQASKRFVQLIADVGDVLTPAQRKTLTDHLEQMHGMAPHFR
jgi:periplasmic protein CpxP/Spy